MVDFFFVAYFFFLLQMQSWYQLFLIKYVVSCVPLENCKILSPHLHSSCSLLPSVEAVDLWGFIISS